MTSKRLNLKTAVHIAFSLFQLAKRKPSLDLSDNFVRGCATHPNLCNPVCKCTCTNRQCQYSRHLYGKYSVLGCDTH